MDVQRSLAQLEADPFASALGVRLVDTDGDGLTLEMTVSDEHLNFMGATHGGVVFGLADVALSLASNAERTAVAIDAHIVYSSASSPGDVLRVDIERVTGGRTLGTFRATISRGDGRVVAVFTGTVFNKD